MKKFIVILACLLLITGCKDVKLDNGENAVVTFKEGGISAQDLYNELKSLYGGQTIVNLIDSYLLNKKYEVTDAEKEYVNEAVKSTKDNAKNYGMSFEDFISGYYNIPTEEAFRAYLTLNYRRNQFVEDYAKEHVSEKQLNEYYENYIYGDVDASQILITVDAASDASDEDKTNAENEALQKAKDIIKELDNGADFAELAKKYSKDQTSSENGGALGKINDGDLADEALEALRNLKDGAYTSSPVKSEYGYHILFRKSMDEKPSLESVKEKITEKVGKEMAQEDGYGAKALTALREENEMKFVDTDLEDSYKALSN